MGHILASAVRRASPTNAGARKRAKGYCAEVGGPTPAIQIQVRLIFILFTFIIINRNI